MICFTASNAVVLQEFLGLFPFSSFTTIGSSLQFLIFFLTAASLFTLNLVVIVIILDSKRKTLNTLRTASLYLSTEGYYQRLTISDASAIDSLISKYEEVDFRLMVYVKHAIDSNSPVIIRSHSADTGIFIMALTSFYSTNLILDSGTGAGRKIVQMSDVEIEEGNRNALISFHSIHFSAGENNKLENNEQQNSF